MVLQILFWILLILTAIGAFIPITPMIDRGRWVVLLILIAILGLCVFGNPVHK